MLRVCAVLLAFSSCTAHRPAERAEPVSHDLGEVSLEMQEWRSRLQRIDAAFRRDPAFYCLPSGVDVDIDKLRISAAPFDGGTTVGSAMAEVQTLVLRRPDGSEIVLPKLKEMTVSIAGHKLATRAHPVYELDSTLAHELAHVWFASKYPMLYVKSRDFGLIEGHAVSTQFRWLRRFYPEVSEEEFLMTRVPSYRAAYWHFHAHYMKDGLVDWNLIEAREMRLRLKP